MKVVGGGSLEDRIKNAEKVGERLKHLLVEATSKNYPWLIRNLHENTAITYPGKDIIITIFDPATPAIDSHSILVKLKVNDVKE